MKVTVAPQNAYVVLETSPGHTIKLDARPASLVMLAPGVGPQGPPGPPGGGGYTHTQSTPSATWVVNHNLGVRPSVAVLSPGGIEVEAEIAHISVNQTEIRFTSPQTGTARFI